MEVSITLPVMVDEFDDPSAGIFLAIAGVEMLDRKLVAGNDVGFLCLPESIPPGDFHTGYLPNQFTIGHLIRIEFELGRWHAVKAAPVVPEVVILPDNRAIIPRDYQAL